MNKISKVSVLVMFAILFVFQYQVKAQISVQGPTNLTPKQLLDNMLILPPEISGVTIWDVKFNGSQTILPSTPSNSRIGTFVNGPGFTDFPLPEGIIMTTGNILIANSPNSGSTSSTNSSGVAEPQLDSIIAPRTTFLNGASVLEFDFEVNSGFISFEYVFASTEYPTYVCTQYNDVFAFFITGYDPVTEAFRNRNIALVPGTENVIVAVNTINGGGTPSSVPCIVTNTHFFRAVPSNSQTTRYNGFTFIPDTSSYAVNSTRSGLIAKAFILPCTPYHMKLAIANVSDNSLDSGVFLKKNSFTAPSIETVHSYSMAETDTLIKGCNVDTITFNLSQRDPYNSYLYTLYTDGFSDPGISNDDYEIWYFHHLTHEYTLLTGSEAMFSIPADSLSAYMVIKVADNAVFDATGIKKLRLKLDFLTCGTPITDTLVFYLKDNHPIILSDTVISGCEILNQMTVNETGGGDVQHVIWSPITFLDTTNSLTINCNITDTTVYTVIAFDDINCRRDTATITVNITDPPEPSFITDKKSGCPPLTVRFTSTTLPAEADNLFVITDELETINDTIDDATFQYTFNNPGHYSVSYMAKTADGEACEKWLHYNNYIYVSEFPVADFDWFPLEPTNGRPINFTNESVGEDINQFYWNFGNGASTVIENPTHSYHISSDETYTVLFRVTNKYGCSHDTTKQISVIDNYAFYVPNSFTPNNDGTNDEFHPRVADVLKYHLVIFNRYGQSIFQSVNPEEKWDGTHNGQNCPAGSYTWVITYIKYAAPETELRKTGTVSLIR